MYLYSEYSGIVGVVDEAEVHQGVVLDLDVAPGTCVDTDEGTHSLVDGVVDEVQLAYGGSSAEVDDVTTARAVAVDIVDVAAVPGKLTDGHGLAPLVDETLGITGYDAILEYDAGNLDVVCGTSVLLLDREAVGSVGTIELDTLEIESISVRPGIDHMDLSLEYRHRAVSRALSEDGYAVGDVHDVDEVRGTGLLEEDLGSRCLHCVLEFGDR